jgi:hypothetical protein
MDTNYHSVSNQCCHIHPPPLSTRREEYGALEHSLGLLIGERRDRDSYLSPCLYSHVFLRNKPNGNKRTIQSQNAEPLPQHTQFQYDITTTTKVRRAMSQGDWVTSVDLKDAYRYHHVPINTPHRKYLRFAILVYQFKVLPFGLATTPHIFTRLVQGPVQWGRYIKGPIHTSDRNLLRAQ